MAEAQEKHAFNPTDETSASSTEFRIDHGTQDCPKSTLVPEAKPIKNTWWRRNLTLFGIRATQRLTKRRKGSVIRLLGDRFCVKSSHALTLSDAATLQFVAQHTSIPVPKVHSAFEQKGVVYIVMDHIKGKMIGDVSLVQNILGLPTSQKDPFLMLVYRKSLLAMGRSRRSRISIVN
ncbi:MAG: hypothetical protein Q9169_007017 [Polycauliona sp. 2 TL-2023]